MMKYFTQQVTDMNGQPFQIVMLEDGAQITQYDENPLWQAYLQWLAEGNTPEEWINE
jgi:hypothetical protein